MENLIENTNCVVTTVLPIVNGNGANYLAMNLAFACKEKNANAQVAVVDFDFLSPFLGAGMHDDKIHGIDNLIDKINGDFLTDELFEQNMIRLKAGIFLLRGTQMGSFRQVVRPQHLEAIMRHLKRQYDYVFIAVNASHLDGGAVTGIFEADNILVLGRYNKANELRAKDTAEIVKSISNNPNVGVVYNFYNGQKKIHMPQEFSKWAVIGLVEYQETTIDNVNLLARGLSIAPKKVIDTKEIFNNILEAFQI